MKGFFMAISIVLLCLIFLSLIVFEVPRIKVMATSSPTASQALINQNINQNNSATDDVSNNNNNTNSTGNVTLRNAPAGI